MGSRRGVRWWWWGVVLALGVLSCLPVLTGAPCSTDENCPSSQHCVEKRCETGSRATGGGTGEAVRGGVHELRCDDGRDDDADGASDCEDPDCEGVVCRAAAGDCDLEERCLAGLCPADELQLSGATCRPVVGECDLEERCTGGPRCPVDLSRCPMGEYCEPSGCVPQRALAAACTADVQCLSGSCVDGVCCDTRCEGACDTCSTGTCSAADAGAPGNPSCAPFVCAGTTSCPLGCTDSSHCVSTSYCAPSGTCLPRAEPGADCTTGAECASGFCVAGTCCDTACTGACEVCDSAAARGRCIPAPAGAAGTPSCSPYVCGGSSPVCPAGCTTDLQCAAGLYCGTGRTCVPALSNATACTTGNQCLSGHCVDGQCCSSACDQACDTCTAGTCVEAPAASPGRPSCAPFVCDGAGAACPTACSEDADCAAGFTCAGGTCGAPRPNGQACTSDGQCASHHCADGFCCDTACAGACDVCNAPPGTCRPATAGASPRPSCSGARCNGTQASCPSSCTGAGCAQGFNCTNGVCVSNGGNGANCTNGAQCTSGNCVGGVCCNSACGGACDACDTGTCAPVGAGAPGSPSCAPYLCNGSSAGCPSSCTTDTQCASGRFCQAGRCVARLSDGAACTGSSLCASGHCVDGVCCNTGCTGACNACDVSGSVGTCRAVTGPGNPSCAPYLCNGTRSGCPLSCASDANCLATHYCSATGACLPRRSDAQSCSGDAQCTSGHCVDGVCCDTSCAGACDTCAGGTCHPRADGTAGSPSCAPYLCDGSSASCPTHCGTDADCAPSNRCADGTCSARLALGAACTSGNQCGTGNCVDGVCCNSSCGSACASCDQAGALGTCTPHPAGSDPENGCGLYTCDGAGACRTRCAQACGAECKTTSWCNAGACLARRSSGACTEGCECVSGFCADGVCCDTACSGACVSCALSGSEGTCTARPAGTDPENGCGNTSCDGAGACTAGCSPPGSCPASCGAGSFCTASGVCGPTLLAGESCTAACQCASARCTLFFRDVDADGYGASPGEQRCGEAPPAGYASRGGDCDDANAQVHPGATELPGDEVDSDCNGEELCYRDDDGDGFRVEDTIVSRNDLSCGDGHEARASEPSGDCCDSDADVHPGQTAYFDTERRCGGQRYDYDCDGVQTQQWTQSSAGGPACSGSGGTTCVEQPGLGWVAPVPACGRRDDFSQCAVTDDACATSIVRRRQACR